MCWIILVQKGLFLHHRLLISFPHISNLLPPPPSVHFYGSSGKSGALQLLLLALSLSLFLALDVGQFPSLHCVLDGENEVMCSWKVSRELAHFITYQLACQHNQTAP